MNDSTAHLFQEPTLTRADAVSLGIIACVAIGADPLGPVAKGLPEL